MSVFEARDVIVAPCDDHPRTVHLILEDYENKNMALAHLTVEQAIKIAKDLIYAAEAVTKRDAAVPAATNMAPEKLQ